MGFNKRKMEDARRQAAEKKAAARRATDRQILDWAAMSGGDSAGDKKPPVEFTYSPGKLCLFYEREESLR